jgi:hypothetical protein
MEIYLIVLNIFLFGALIIAIAGGARIDKELKHVKWFCGAVLAYMEESTQQSEAELRDNIQAFIRRNANRASK